MNLDYTYATGKDYFQNVTVFFAAKKPSFILVKFKLKGKCAKISKV